MLQPFAVSIYVEARFKNSNNSVIIVFHISILSQIRYLLDLCTFIGRAIIDGKWTSWSSWSQCSKTCNIGEHIRSRDCTNPPPENNGEYCVGPNSEKEYCLTAACQDPSGKKIGHICVF